MSPSSRRRSRVARLSFNSWLNGISRDATSSSRSPKISRATATIFDAVRQAQHRKEELAAGAQVLRRLPEHRDREARAVGASQRHLGREPRRHDGDFLRDTGDVVDDDVEPHAADRLEEVTARDADPVGHAVERRIALGEVARLGHEVARVHGLRAGPRHRDRDGAGPAAQVQDRASGHAGPQHFGHQQRGRDGRAEDGGVGLRDECPGRRRSSEGIRGMLRRARCGQWRKARRFRRGNAKVMWAGSVRRPSAVRTAQSTAAKVPRKVGIHVYWRIPRAIARSGTAVPPRAHPCGRQKNNSLNYLILSLDCRRVLQFPATV